MLQRIGGEGSSYSYDNAGNRVSKDTPRVQESYVYDPLYRLTQVSRWRITPFCSYSSIAGEAYTYDPAGNRLTSLSTTGNWVYDDRNELRSNSTDTFSYDANGNLAQKVEGPDTWTYQWDAENRLKSVLKNGIIVASFAYDPLGRRIQKVGSGVTTTYLYDGQAILAQTAAGATLRFIHGPRIDEPLAQVDSSANLSLYYADALGSIVGYDYDAFGNGATQAGYAFTGREWDPETNLYYYRARYYDPKIGRFLSEDPIRFLGGVNFYAYVANNPVNRRDPSGLQACCPEGSFWFCYERCVNKFLLNPVGFGAATVIAATTNTVANAPSGVGNYTNAQFATGVAAAWVGAKTGVVNTIQQFWQATKAGQVLGGAAGTAASAATGVAAVWGAGVVLGCATACSIDPCTY